MSKNNGKSQGYYISVLYRHLQIYLNHQFSSLGFGSGQYLYFSYIAHNEGITQKDLNSILSIDKATTAKAVRKLTELDYIEQRQNETDKRYNNLYLTEKGKEILPEVQNTLRQTRTILQNKMSKEEIERSSELMELMLQNLINETDILKK